MKYLADVKLQIEEEKVAVTDFFKIKDSVIEILTPFIGKKILKVDSTLIAKINDAMKQALSPLKRTRFMVQHKSLYIHMSYAFDDKSGVGCHYRDLDFFIGNLADDLSTLENLSNDFLEYEKKLNINFEYVAAVMLNVAAKLKECEELQRSIPYYAKQELPYVGDVSAKDYM